MEFATISDFIESLKFNENIVGIVEYGGRQWNDLSKGGDYDLTVITKNMISEDIGGLHFHIAGIPIDCIIKSVADFLYENPLSPFDTIHLNCKILFDREGITEGLLKRIKTAWSNSFDIAERDILWFRFVFKHVIDKLRYRLHDDELYSNYSMADAMRYFLQSYEKIKNRKPGKIKDLLKYIKENESDLYNMLENYFKASDLDTKFHYLELCADYMAKDIGGVWQEGEVLFHLNKAYTSKEEKDKVYNFIFNNGL